MVTFTTEATVRLTQLITAADFDWHDVEYTLFVLERRGSLDGSGERGRRRERGCAETRAG